MDAPAWATIVAALVGGGVGTILGGVFDTWKRSGERRREALSVLVAIKAEVGAVCQLIRYNDYRQVLVAYQNHAAALAAIDLEQLAPTMTRIGGRQDYMIVYNANVAKVGLLSPEDVGAIVQFYVALKSMLDNFEDSADLMKPQSALEFATLLNRVIDGLDELLRRGDAISPPRAKGLLAHHGLSATPDPA